MSALCCPSCRQPMQQHRFRRKLGGELALDICTPCQGIWFDDFESLQLAPAGIVELFRLIHEQDPGLRQPLAASLQCPRCDGALIHSQDRVKSGHFNYLRCGGHGRFISFGQFMIEKGFVRQLNPAEITALKPQVALLRCSSCGAPVDVRKDSACSHCRAPIAVLDADAVKKALAEYTRQPANSPAVPPPPRGVGGSRNKAGGATSEPEAVDLLRQGIESLWDSVLS